MFNILKKLFHRECSHRWQIRRHVAALINGEKHPIAVCRDCGKVMTANGILEKRVPLVKD